MMPPMLLEIAWRRGRRGLLALAVSSVVVLSGCTGDAEPPSDGGGVGATTELPAPAPVQVRVSPRKPFVVTLPDGTRIRGPRGAVSKAGVVVATQSTATAPQGSPLYDDALSGFDLTYPGELRRPLRVALPAMAVPAGVGGNPRRAMPVAVHVADDGTVSYQPVTRQGDRFVFSTDDFSFWAPSWLDPLQWIKDLFAAAGRAFAGTTEPPSCQDAEIAWADLLNASPLINTCLKDNTSSRGASRAEVFWKSNRNYYLKVGWTDGEDYSWTEGADTVMGAALQYFMRGEPARLMAGGEQMSVGYLRPSLDATRNVTAYADLTTAVLSVVQELTNLVVPDERGGFAALWALKTCADKIPSDLRDAGGWGNVLTCVFADALPQLANDQKAVSVAYSWLQGMPSTYSREGVAQLTDTAHKAQLLGKVFKVLGLAQVIQAQVIQIVDGVDEALHGRKSASLTLTAGSLSTTRVLNSVIPPHVCFEPSFGGWDGPNAIRLRDGTGQAAQGQDSYGGTSYVSVLDSEVLGWADFDGDHEPEVAMRLRCSGSRLDQCCAGQSSLLNYIAVFDVGPRGSLIQFGDSLPGTSVYPGDEYGPASSSIATARLDQTTVVTGEGVLYVDNYRPGQLSGVSRNGEFTTSHTMNTDGTWTNTVRGR